MKENKNLQLLKITGCMAVAVLCCIVIAVFGVISYLLIDDANYGYSGGRIDLIEAEAFIDDDYVSGSNAAGAVDYDYDIYIIRILIENNGNYGMRADQANFYFTGDSDGEYRIVSEEYSYTNFDTLNYYRQPYIPAGKKVVMQKLLKIEKGCKELTIEANHQNEPGNKLTIIL